MPFILVIEDDKLVREFLRLTLTEAGYQVLAVPDGRSGIERAREETPSAVVLDLKIPGISGNEVLRTLKSMAPSLPVFLHSVYCDFPEKMSEASGADGCFVKSGDLTRLLQAIERAVGPGGETGKNRHVISGSA